MHQVVVISRVMCERSKDAERKHTGRALEQSCGLFGVAETKPCGRASKGSRGWYNGRAEHRAAAQLAGRLDCCRVCIVCCVSPMAAAPGAASLVLLPR